MVSGLLSASAAEHDPGDFVHRHARLLTRFDQRSQDSENVSWLVETDDEDFFVKSAGALAPADRRRRDHTSIMS